MARQASSQPDSGSPSTATLRSKNEIRWQRADDEVRKNLPPGVKLLRTLRGHTDTIGRIAWSPDGRLLASPSADGTIRLWMRGCSIPAAGVA